MSSDEKIQIVLEALNKASQTINQVVAQIGGLDRANSNSARAQEKANVALQAAERTYGRLKLVIAGATAAVLLFFRALLTEVDDIAKLARALDTTTEKLSRLRFAADLGGIGARQLSISLNTLQQAMEEAANDAGSKAAKRFTEMGFALKGIANRDVIDVFFQMSDAFETHSGAATKAAIAQELLADRSKVMVDFLNQGSAAIKESGVELDKFSGTIDKNTAKQVEDFNDNLTRMHAALKGLGVVLVSQLFPALSDFITGIIKFIEESHFAIDAVTSMGKGLVYMWGGFKAISTIVAGVVVTAFEDFVIVLKANIELVAIFGKLLGDVAVAAVKNFQPVLDLMAALQKGDALGAFAANARLQATILSGGLVATADAAKAFQKAWEDAKAVTIKATGDVVKTTQENATVAFGAIMETAEATARQIESLNTLQKNPNINVTSQEVPSGTKDTRTALDTSESFRGAWRDVLQDLQKQFQNFNTAGKAAAHAIGNAFEASLTTISHGLGDIIRGTETWTGLLLKIGNVILDVVIESIVKMFGAWVVGRLSVSAVEKAANSSELPGKLANATATSISSYGVAAVVGLAAVLAALGAVAATGGFAEGGFTGGGGKHDVAGVVHAGEVVIPQSVVRAHGLDHFAAYFGGRMPGYANGGFVRPVTGTGSVPSSVSQAAPTINIASIQTRNELREFMAKEGAKIVIDNLNRRGGRA